MSYSPLLLVHICAGTSGLLSGAAAVSFRKGSRRHRIAGDVFSISILSMAASGVYMALMKSQMGNVYGGTITFYLVLTGWMTGRRREGGTGILDWCALLLALLAGTAMVANGIDAANSAAGSKDGVPAGMYFFLGSVALLAATGDIRMFVRGGVSGVQRLVRHLWRMCFGLFIAAASIFIARPHLFPAILRQTHVLLLLGVLPLILMIFWLVRVRFTHAYERRIMPRGEDVYLVKT